MIAFLFGFGCGVVLAIAAFLWLNRHRPAALDAAEEAARKK